MIKRSTLAATMALIACSRQPQGWATLAPLTDGPRQETAVVALAEQVYVLGGFTETQSIVPRVEVYDPKSKAWRDSAPLPRPLHHANAAAVGGQLYVLGALVGSQFNAVGDTYRYDPKTGVWEVLASMPAGTERGAAATAVIGTKIFVAGGFRGGRSVADVSAYDSASDTWEILLSLSEARDHLVGGAVGGKVYAIGGRRDGALRGDVDEFDPASGKWISKAAMLTARAGCAAAVIADRIYVAGGEGNPNRPSGVFEQNEVFDPAKNRWDALEAMLTPRHGTGGAALNGVFYVPGGATRQGFGAVDTHEAYTP